MCTMWLLAQYKKNLQLDWNSKRFAVWRCCTACCTTCCLTSSQQIEVLKFGLKRVSGVCLYEAGSSGKSPAVICSTSFATAEIIESNEIKYGFGLCKRPLTGHILRKSAIARAINNHSTPVWSWAYSGYLCDVRHQCWRRASNDPRKCLAAAAVAFSLSS